MATTFDAFLRAACPPLDLDWRRYRRRSARHRVDARLRELQLDGYDAYLQRLQTNPAEAAELAERMRVTVSRFFRERECWECLITTVLPELLQQKAAEQALRVWSVGCGGGEEPYTLALLWREHFAPRPLELLATDIDAAGLKRAAQARYGTGSLRELPPALLARHFRPEGGLWRLDPEVVAGVRFERRNFLHPPLPEGMDLVCCRYLAFTYYRGERLRRAARVLWQALRPGGALMLGRKEGAETVGDLFAPWPGATSLSRKISPAGARCPTVTLDVGPGNGSA